MVKWTLVTGATGFVGGEWTLRALLRGEYVAALVRPGREQAVGVHLRELADVHGTQVPSLDKLVVVPWTPGSEFSTLQLLRQSGVDHISCVIHAAADMTYSLSKLPNSLDNNLGMALGLYRAIAEHAPEAKKFIAVSTAYPCGLNPAADIPETLHLTPKLVNGYQTSKWATEMALTELARAGGPALTILRPSIVVGEGERGFYTGKCFGFYMFLRGFALAKKAGAKKMRVAINPAAEINLLPIDQLLLLIDRIREKGAPGFVHATLDNGVRVGDMMEVIGKIYGFPIEEGKPRSIPEHLFDRQVAANMAFANTTFKFNNHSAKALVPERDWVDMNPQSFERVVRQSKALYFQKARFEKSDLAMLPQLLPNPVRKVLRKISRLK